MTDLNDGDLRLRDFKVLSVLLRERSLTRTAEALDTTQPSISKVLARLRIHFRDPLFIRTGQAMNPTPKAMEISVPIHSLLVTANMLRTPTPSFDPRTSDRMFKVLTADTGFALILPRLLSMMAKEGPRLTLAATDRFRLGISIQYVVAWARQQESYLLAVPPEMAKDLSPRLRQLLGYSIHPPFMGHVDGRHPEKMLG